MIGLFAELPALPLHTAGKYVAAAYIVFMLVIVIYVAIMAVRLTSSQKEIIELTRELEEREREQERAASSAGAFSGSAAMATEPDAVASRASGGSSESETVA